MERVMRTLLKKMLAGAVAFTMLLLNLTCGMMTALAEQYYGWSDGSSSYPSALYVTPVGDTTKKIAIPVYCFDYKFQEPLAWKETTQPSHLIVYDKYDSKNLMAALVKKTNMVSYETKTKLQTLFKTKSNLITAILSRGYPNKSFFDKYKKLTDEDKRRVTQCALWYHTDNISEQDLITKHLDGDSGEKSQALKELIGVVKNTSNELGEGLTFYTRYNDRYGPRYQNLIGSIIVPEEPQSNLEIGGGNVIDLTYQSGPMVEEGGHSGGTIEVEDTKKPDVIIGGQGSVTETTEDTQEGMAVSTEAQPEIEDTKQPQSDIILGGQGNVIDTTENTQEGMSGQSGNIAETEDTKQPQSDIILGGQGNVIETTEDTQAGMSGTNDTQTFEEDTRPKLEFHFDNELPNDAPKPEQPEQPKAPQQDQPHLLRPIESNQALPKAHEAKDILALVGVGILSMLGLVFWFRPYQKD
ncbi:TPA: fibronectin binding protein [Streptococcus equi subsp. zooepidemicus]|nr:fibronectin binding protein [Streptococcus equi subsp. zooepidemicus]HEL0196650.1 fibronectin binding protein [Streptococcus equi subsp. zooepidemicus]HEL0206694.1 fibronectin binding protein [Streptococcus equi subsp. zooepidemicus]HEL0532306.1 fibronectin binding protein [Streptococcus equi subsp. zooepidemicus]HEL0568718.1 fibronectin binding protein [Streptococcus equi subsp. zooepidemicus]